MNARRFSLLVERLVQVPGMVETPNGEIAVSCVAVASWHLTPLISGADQLLPGLPRPVVDHVQRDIEHPHAFESSCNGEGNGINGAEAQRHDQLQDLLLRGGPAVALPDDASIPACSKKSVLHGALQRVPSSSRRWTRFPSCVLRSTGVRPTCGEGEQVNVRGPGLPRQSALRIPPVPAVVAGCGGRHRRGRQRGAPSGQRGRACSPARGVRRRPRRRRSPGR